MRRACLVATLALLTACPVEPVDLTGKACPCPDGWSCVRGECVVGDVDGGPPGPDCGSAGAYRLERLEAGWRTQASLQWRWQTASDVDGADLLHYTLVVGTDAEAVDSCACELGRGGTCEEDEELRVLDDTDNPELAHDTRSNNTGGREPVRSTVSGGLAPDTVYAAVLLAFDTTGGVSRTDVVFNRTGRVAERALTVFDRGPIDSGYTIPGCFETGTEGYVYRVSCPPPAGSRGGCKTDEDPCPEESRWPGEGLDEWLCEPDEHPEHALTCWITLRWQDLAVPVGASLSEGAFDEAFVEVVLALERSPANYGELFVGFEDASGEPSFWGLRGELALRGDGTDHVYQIPFRALTREDGTALSWAELRDRPLQRASVGALFAHGSSISVRSIVVRY